MMIFDRLFGREIAWELGNMARDDCEICSV